MQSLQSMDDPVLGLHSCRALSPGPQVEDKPRGGRWGRGGGLEKGLVFGYAIGVKNELQPLNQKTSDAIGS
jgi:hypothetical protein